MSKNFLLRNRFTFYDKIFPVRKLSNLLQIPIFLLNFNISSNILPPVYFSLLVNLLLKVCHLNDFNYSSFVYKKGFWIKLILPNYATPHSLYSHSSHIKFVYFQFCPKFYTHPFSSKKLFGSSGNLSFS